MEYFKLRTIFLAVVFYSIGLLPILANGATWKNLDIRTTIDDQGNASVKESHDVFLEGDEVAIFLPLYLHQDQSIEVTSVTLIDIINKKETTVKIISEKDSTPSTFPYFQFSPTLFSIFLGKGTKDHHLQIKYNIKNLARKFKEGRILKHHWAYPKRNGLIKNLSFLLKVPESWHALEGVPGLVTRSDVEKNNSFLSEINFKLTRPEVKTSALLLNLNAIINCQMKSNLPEKVFVSYVNELPASYIKFKDTIPLTFRLIGSPEGLISLTNLGADFWPDLNLPQEIKEGASATDIARYYDKLNFSRSRVEAEVNKLLNVIFFASSNIFNLNEKFVPSKKFTFTTTKESPHYKVVDAQYSKGGENKELASDTMNIFSNQVKLSLREIKTQPLKIGEQGEITILLESSDIVGSDFDINALAFNLILSECKIY